MNRFGVVEGQIVVNPRRVSGRSTYLCHDQACWTAAEKRRAVERALGVPLAAEDWQRLRTGILN